MKILLSLVFSLMLASCMMPPQNMGGMMMNRPPLQVNPTMYGTPPCGMPNVPPPGGMPGIYGGGYGGYGDGSVASMLPSIAGQPMNAGTPSDPMMHAAIVERALAFTADWQAETAAARAAVPPLPSGAVNGVSVAQNDANVIPVLMRETTLNSDELQNHEGRIQRIEHRRQRR